MQFRKKITLQIVNLHNPHRGFSRLAQLQQSLVLSGIFLTPKMLIPVTFPVAEKHFIR